MSLSRLGGTDCGGVHDSHKKKKKGSTRPPYTLSSVAQKSEHKERKESNNVVQSPGVIALSITHNTAGRGAA